MEKKIPLLASKQLEEMLVPIENIKPHPENYKDHTEDQLNSLRASLMAFGWTTPIKANLKGVIVAGHGMYLLALQEGFTHIPVETVALDDNLSKAYLMADNETARKGKTDPDKLNSLLNDVSQIEDFNLDALGFEQDFLDSVLGTEPEFELEAEEEEEESLEAPKSFQEYDENIKTDHRCPKCGYEWSGAAK